MPRLITIGLVVLLIINWLYVFGGVLYHPLQSMDAIGIWFLKAKAFHLEQGFPNQFLHTARYSYSHQQYPLGLPFLIYSLYRVVGGVQEKAVFLVYPLIYGGILALAYAVMKRTTTTPTALLITYSYSMVGPLVAAGGRILAGTADIILLLCQWLILFTLYKKRLTLTRLVTITALCQHAW